MESDVFYGAIKTNDHFYELELFFFSSFKTHYATLAGFYLIIWYIKSILNVKY